MIILVTAVNDMVMLMMTASLKLKLKMNLLVRNKLVTVNMVALITVIMIALERGVAVVGVGMLFGSSSVLLSVLIAKIAAD